jgi:hypothetical protein
MAIISYHFQITPCILLLAFHPTSEAKEEPRLHMYKPWSPKVRVILFLKQTNMYSINSHDLQYMYKSLVIYLSLPLHTNHWTHQQILDN